MDIKNLIINYLKTKKSIKISDIVKKTGFSRAYIHRFFRELQDEGKIVSLGKTNRTHYVFLRHGDIQGPLSWRRVLVNKNISEDVVLGDIKKETAVFDKLKKNIVDILNYAFTELLNNAIEHSKSRKILIQINRMDGLVKFQVIDWGVGIFKDIKRKFKLKNIFEAIELLLKGKQTTAPERHTGEGIFFASRASDELIIQGSNKKLIFDNKINDIFIRDAKKAKGTKVVFGISTESSKILSKIFSEYSDEDFVFDKTKITVKLFELGREFYISRSQARRLLFGLEKFKRVVLDFKQVKTVGQAFADEIFRVWQKKYPGIKIEYVNFDRNIEFMINRARKRGP